MGVMSLQRSLEEETQREAEREQMPPPGTWLSITSEHRPKTAPSFPALRRKLPADLALSLFPTLQSQSIGQAQDSADSCLGWISGPASSSCVSLCSLLSSLSTDIFDYEIVQY